MVVWWQGIKKKGWRNPFPWPKISINVPRHHKLVLRKTGHAKICQREIGNAFLYGSDNKTFSKVVLRMTVSQTCCNSPAYRQVSDRLNVWVLKSTPSRKEGGYKTFRSLLSCLDNFAKWQKISSFGIGWHWVPSISYAHTNKCISDMTWHETVK